MRKLGFLILLSLSVVVFEGLGILSPRNILYLWDGNELADIKSNPEKASVLQKYVAKADSCLSLPPLSVVNKTWSFSDDLHYYCTMAPYWWPEEVNGKTVYVNRDGKENPQSRELDRAKIAQLGDRLKLLSLAYYFTEDNKYYKAYIDQMDIWFIDEETLMYPTFLYAQVVPGMNGNKGRSVGIIDGHGFNEVLESFRLVDFLKSVGPVRKSKFVEWFRELGDWMATSDQGIQQSKADNNLGISYDVTLLNISLFVGDRARADGLVNGFSNRRTARQIDDEGKLPGELARTKAFSYSAYCLDFFVDFYLLADAAGYDLYNKDKTRFNSAYGYLLQFVDNHEAFPYNQIVGWRDSTKSLMDQIDRLKRIDPEIADNLKLEAR